MIKKILRLNANLMKRDCNLIKSRIGMEPGVFRGAMNGSQVLCPPSVRALGISLRPLDQQIPDGRFAQFAFGK